MAMLSASQGHSSTTSATDVSPSVTCRFSSALAKRTRLACCSARMCCGAGAVADCLHRTSPRPILSRRAWYLVFSTRSSAPAMRRASGTRQRRSRRLLAALRSETCLSSPLSPARVQRADRLRTVVTPRAEGQRSTTLGIRKKRGISRADCSCAILDKTGRRKTASQSQFCANGSADDPSRRRRGRHVHGPRGARRNPRDDGQGAEHARRSVGGCDARARGRRGRRRGRVRARDDGRHQRAARAPRRAHRAGHHRGLPRPDRARAPGPPVALRPRRAAPGAARAARPALHGARADGARRRARAARRGRACRRRSTALREAEVDAVAVCLLFAFLHPEHEQARRRGGARGARATCTSRSRARCCPSSASTSASRPRSPTPTSARSSPPTSSGWRAAPTRRACRRRWSCSPRAGWSTSAWRRRQAAGCVLSGPAGGVVGAAHVARASGYEDVLTFDMGGT